ncbi:MAG: hypothetical protein ABEH43_05540, partial [Flavobacteriales bacterium]
MTQNPYFGAFFSSFIFALVYTEGFNAWCRCKGGNYYQGRYIVEAISEVGSELDILFSTSFNYEEQVMITLENNKVYIGYVLELPIPSVSNYIRLMPLLSGYRDQKDKKLHLTTKYIEAYKEYESFKSNYEDDEPSLRTDLIIPYHRIMNASYFDS